MPASLPQFLFEASFAATCWTILVFPFGPAWREWRTPSDSDPLPIRADDADHASAQPAAASELHLGENSVLANHLSASTRIVLERGCCFLHLHAPRIEFGAPGVQAAGSPPAGSEAHLGGLPAAIQLAGGVWRIHGDCRLPAYRTYTGSLIVTGSLWVGEGSCIVGSVKAHGSVVLAAAARVTGAVVCCGVVLMQSCSAVGGPLVSESDVMLCTGARVGAAGRPTTLSAPRIAAQAGSTAHGAVSARQAGVVLGAVA